MKVGKNRAKGSSEWSDLARSKDPVCSGNVVPKAGSASGSPTEWSQNASSQPPVPHTDSISFSPIMQLPAWVLG